MDKIQQLWTAILDLLAKLVIPDWGALIALLPIALVALVVLWLLWLVRAYMHVGPKRRAVIVRQPVPPPGVHPPGPSFAPFFGAIGAGLLFFGLVLGGTALLLGLLALVLSLVYWLREGMLDYDHVAGVSSLPVVVEHEGPPPGVHVPGPTFLPLVSAVAAAILFVGILIGGWVLLASVVCLVIGLLGWLRAAAIEYRLTEEADRTGHMRNAAPPRFPGRLFGFYAVILLSAAIVQAGVLPPNSATAGGGSPAPGASAPAGGSPAAPGSPPPPGRAADVTITAQNIAFTTTEVTAPANKPFTLAFQNLDSGTPHDVDIKTPAGADAYKGEVFVGVATNVYQVPALAPGTYPFVCVVHPTMTGTLTVK